MTTLFVITLAALILGGVYYGLRKPPRPEAVAYLNRALALADRPGTAVAHARCAERHRQEEDRKARAYAWLAEMQRQFAPVLERQTAMLAGRGRQLGWSQETIKDGLALVRATYDSAVREEVKCAVRLFGARAVRDALRGLDMAATMSS